ncbi:MAG: redox-regulated ATPase YchF [Bacteroidales bacterium]|nr:redox-regulated ATPase YchF [Bacteroidales bacterium]
MALNCGIVGIAGSGKTTLFNALSKGKSSSGQLQGRTNLGQIEVPDQRLEALARIIKPAKVVPTTVEIIDIPGLTKGAGQIKGGNQFLADIRQTDAIIHVLRCFDDDTVPHIEGSVNPLRDKEIIDLELITKDIDTVEKKRERLRKVAAVGDKDAKRGTEVLTALIEHLEEGSPARTFSIHENDRKYLDDCYLLTVKPLIYVCNVDEGSASAGNQHTAAVQPVIQAERCEMLIVAAEAESEIARLEDEEDRKAFLADLGIEEPAVNQLIRAAYNTLRLQTFFTEGPREVRAWTIRAGTPAPKAAGTIHSDMERGFIRAEVMRVEDFLSLGSEQACKQAGKFNIEGKNYIVQDGDIFHVRFNV